MFHIELTRGTRWNAPAIEKHTIQRLLHIADVERTADALLMKARARNYGPTGYRIVDHMGRRLRVKSEY